MSLCDLSPVPVLLLLASGSHHVAFPLVENPGGSLANRKTPGGKF